MPPLAMGRRSCVGGGEEGNGPGHAAPHMPRRPTLRRPGRAPHTAGRWIFAALVLLQLWVGQSWAMKADRISRLRHETVKMFYHSFDNYMKIAFPEDEVRSIL